ncbi:hypothetical protein ACIRYZ_41195 [Kitasatospora sp. NPDC101155]|uniref:hypothetical protein n=1 Tax=Kitasatospora sp. NPDC101155 TaxID=3364097 RepID=UPI00380CEDCB
MSAASGGIGVSSQAFAWDDTPITTDPDGFYAFVTFVTQFGDTPRSPVPPTASSALEMSALLKRADLGWRATATFAAGESAWRRELAMTGTVPHG